MPGNGFTSPVVCFGIDFFTPGLLIVAMINLSGGSFHVSKTLVFRNTRTVISNRIDSYGYRNPRTGVFGTRSHGQRVGEAEVARPAPCLESCSILDSFFESSLVELTRNLGSTTTCKFI